jgi:succinoglycan biosynthesis protein ExoA
MTQTSLPTNPLVTVIMAIRNEASFIQKSLGAVLKQDYPPQHTEILIVDGMSDDGTRAIIGEMLTQYQYPASSLRILDNPDRVKPRALNIGLTNATGDIVVIVDGHCEIAPDYLSQGVKHLKKNDVVAVGGPIETVALDEGGETIAIAMSTPFAVGGASFRTGTDKDVIVDTVAFPAYRREIMQKAGPFDETMKRTEDDEYNYRLR